jgi:hypothetical protein
MIVIIILLALRVQYPVDRDQWISYSLCNKQPSLGHDVINGIPVSQPLIASQGF